MLLFRRLVLHILAALLMPFLVGWYVSGQFFPLAEAQGRTMRLLLPVALAVLLVATYALVARLVAPVRAALARPAAQLGAQQRQAATLAAMKLPTRLSGGILVVAATLIALLVGALRRAGLPTDVALASAAAALAFAVMAAMLAYSVVAIDVAPAIASLGPAEVAERGTVRGKVLVVCYGILAIATLLVGSMSYARYRTDGDESHIALMARAMDVGAQASRAEGAARAATFAYRATGAPVVAVSATGELIAGLGSRPDLAERVKGPPVEPIEGGWLVRRQTGTATLVAFVSEAPLVARRHAFWRSAAVLGLVVFAAASLLVWAAAETLTAPLGTLGKAADQIAGGDLTAAPPSVTRDEMGQLAADFRRMALGLSGLVLDVQAASRGVHDGAREMGEIGNRVRGGALEEHDRVIAVNAAVEAMQESVTQVGRGVDGLAEYVASTSSVVGEMAAALEEVRRQAADLTQTVEGSGVDVDKLSQSGRRAQTQLAALNDLATSAGVSLGAVSASLASLQGAADESQANAAAVAELADASGVVVEQAVGGIETLRAAVHDAKARVAALGRRSDDVDQILDFVGEVAGRTNLLSLNASIIATQAGEHGKAFAVVADQIRELAAQIASSTKSIGDIIGAVRDDVAGTARLIDRGDELAANGVALARKSLDALHEIRGATARGRETAASIQGAVQAHAKSSGAVADLVNSVAVNSRAVAETIQMVGRSVASVHSVNRSVGALADRVSRALEEQSGLGRRQLEGLERINARLAEIGRAVEAHESATRRVRELLSHLTRTAAQHESAVSELAGLAERLGGRSRALADRVGRFKV
jgi:methyl-accepting chemotaxis protein